MTFKDLAKILASNSQKNTNHTFKNGLSYSAQMSHIPEWFNQFPFWVWADSTQHCNLYIQARGKCCWNHIIGLPRDNKTGEENSLFDYQKVIYEALEKYRHLFILKATGLGISEFFRRYMSWLALRNNDYQNSQMVIVTGPNIDLAIKLIRRMKKLFEPLGIFFDSKETVLELNKCRIEAYPSNHIDSFRSLDNPKFILLDECDFFRKGEHQEVRDVAERYIAKSNPCIVLVSTPNAPGGLMETIEQEPEDSCLYKRIKLDYRVGLGKIYTLKDIEKAKQSPGFEREYNLKYLGKIGNIFSLQDIETAIKLGEQYKDLVFNHRYLHVGGIDPSFSSSTTAITICEIDVERQIIRVILS